MIKFSCPGCGKRFSMKEIHASRPISCTRCKKKFRADRDGVDLIYIDDPSVLDGRIHKPPQRVDPPPPLDSPDKTQEIKLNNHFLSTPKKRPRRMTKRRTKPNTPLFTLYLIIATPVWSFFLIQILITANSGVDTSTKIYVSSYAIAIASLFLLPAAMLGGIAHAIAARKNREAVLYGITCYLIPIIMPILLYIAGIWFLFAFVAGYVIAILFCAYTGFLPKE